MEVIVRVALAVLGIVAVVGGTYLDDDAIRASTAGDRNRHHNE